MTQLGARDEARLLGGLGVCGKTLCGSTWLKEFRPISIQMANARTSRSTRRRSRAIAGALLCCLAYENDQYPSGKKGQPGPAPGAEAS